MVKVVNFMKSILLKKLGEKNKLGHSRAALSNILATVVV